MYSLITNSKKGNLLDELISSFETCKGFYLNVAFVNFSGLQLLLDPLKRAEENGAKGKVLTGTYLNFTDPIAIRRLKEFQNIETKIFVTTAVTGFHPKAYIFEYENYYKVIIGSSNLTQSALKSNIEWNLKVITKDNQNELDKQFIQELLGAFDDIWERSEHTDEDLLQAYEEFKGQKLEDVVNDSGRSAIFKFTRDPKIKPNLMQQRATERLNFLRNREQERALIIAATGTGKTYLSAFDVKQLNPPKMLFLVHRENILLKAQESFENVLSFKHRKTGILSGNRKDYEADYLFSTMQTMQRQYEEFKPDAFDYIIIDEAHHATSPSYEKILNYFKPKFLLGMTATPERSDGGNIFELFDHNVALEVRLRDALEQDLLVPFHYFGITEVEGVDLSDVDPKDMAEIAKRLMLHRRVDFIIEKMKFYGHDGLYMKALGFCATVEHAQYMSAEFNKRGIDSVALTGEDSVHKRELYIKRIEDDQDSLKVIFTVDIFNEGIDIPSVNVALMLRPTNSAIVFTQQLGRGLRKKESKEFLTVLDFIGNHSKSFLLAIALHGSRFYDKDSLKVAVKKNFPEVPGSSHIQLDEISKEQILTQLDQENFASLSYLRNDYFEFKAQNQGQIPWFLQEYLKYENAPDPVRFFNKAKNYIDFLSKTEKNNPQVLELSANQELMSVLNYLSDLLPIKRIHEFVILDYLRNHQAISLEVAKREIEKQVDQADDDTVLHAFETLNLNYADKGQISRIKRLVQWDEEAKVLQRTELFLNLVEDNEASQFLKDTLHYGMLRYEKEFGTAYYGIPHFKRYEEYSMIETALLSNHRKTHSSFRGAGVLKNPSINHYFFFVDLHKGEDVETRLNYQDKLISPNQFQWESPNNTRLSSDRGKDFTDPDNRGTVIHLFARKFREIDGVTSKFIYLGKVHPISHRNEQPIEIQYRLEDEIPYRLFEEFEPELAVQEK